MELLWGRGSLALEIDSANGPISQQGRPSYDECWPERQAIADLPVSEGPQTKTCFFTCFRCEAYA